MSVYMKKQANQNKKLVLAITGGFGTGKTTVAGYFRRFGARVVDADKIVHNLLKSGSAVYKKIIIGFGRGILKKDKSIDRASLAKAVFGDRKLLNKLNKIIHPQVIKIMQKEIASAREKVVVLDVPLLFEAGLQRLADKVLVVRTNRKIQLRRIFKKTSLSQRDILMRIKAQLPLSTKVRRADFVIDNDGTQNRTKKQVANLRRMLWKN
jgi:dephospho-CoA kinase